MDREFCFVKDQLQKYCKMCDAAPETYLLMKKDVPNLVYGLKKVDPA